MREVVARTSEPAHQSASRSRRWYHLGRAFAHIRWPFTPRTDAPGDETRAAISTADLEVAIVGGLSDRGGELAARGRAAVLGSMYQEATDDTRRAILLLLAERFGYDTDRISTVSTALAIARGSSDSTAALLKLWNSLESPRVKLFRRFSTMPDGTRFVVDLQADVRRFLEQEPTLAPLDAELKRLLSAWFDPGMLELRRLNWSTSADRLEKLIEYESVHAIRDWKDLKSRLRSDRRVYALVHPRMDSTPVAFVEVALSQGIPRRIGAILDADAPIVPGATADTAVFYSITSALPGLAGIPFGHFLLARAMSELSSEHPGLARFVTLSPIPGFRKWLEEAAEDLRPDSPVSAFFADAEECQAFVSRLQSKESVDEGVLLRLVAHYLVRERTNRGHARDAVAHFHFSNGARLEMLHPWANHSDAGWSQSGAVMATYEYDPREAERNLDGYLVTGEVAHSPAVSAWLAEPTPAS